MEEVENYIKGKIIGGGSPRHLYSIVTLYCCWTQEANQYDALLLLLTIPMLSTSEHTISCYYH